MSGLIGKVFVRSMSRIDSKTKVDLLHIVSGIRKSESQEKKKKAGRIPVVRFQLDWTPFQKWVFSLFF
jgi:hypothetical protein